MTTTELKNNFEQTVMFWQNALENYTEEDLSAKENETSWSLGQVYEHLTSMSKRILALAERLNHGDDNSHEEKTANGINTFKENSLGVKKIHSPANATSPPKQTENKAELAKDLVYLKQRFSELCDATNNSMHKGKHNHPILGFLNAKEWLQFIEMHFRHHVHQKERIDEFLRTRVKTN